MTDRGVLWDAAVQARDPADVASRANDALQHEWARVWEEGVPFYQRRYEAAGLSRAELPPLDEIPTTTKPDLRADEAANRRALGLDR